MWKNYKAFKGILNNVVLILCAVKLQKQISFLRYELKTPLNQFRDIWIIDIFSFQQDLCVKKTFCTKPLSNNLEKMANIAFF